MPDEQHEIVKYEFQADIRDLEEKAKRAHALATETGDTAGFKAWRQRETTEAALNRPYDEAQRRADQDAFETWRTAARAEEEQLKSTSSATETLIQHKRGLVNVISVLGGSFGGLAGHLIGIVALMAQGGAAMAGWIAGAVGLTLLVTMFNDIAAAAERAAAAQNEYNAAVREGQEVRGERLAALGEQLESYGMRSEATARNAEEIQGKLADAYGFTGARGTRAAGLAAAMGLGVEDAARLAVAMGAGAQISTPADANRFIGEAKKAGAWDTLLHQAETFKRDTIGMHERALAAAPMEGGRAGQDPVAEAYQGLKKQPGGLGASGLPSNLSIDDFRAALAGDTMAIGRALYPDLLIPPGGGRGGMYGYTRMIHPGEGDVATPKELKKAEELVRTAAPLKGYAKLIRAIQAGQEQVRTPETFNEPTPPLSEEDLTFVGLGMEPSYASQPGQRVINVVNNYNQATHIGTAYNDREGPARQREQKSHFNLDTVDIKARH